MKSKKNTITKTTIINAFKAYDDAHTTCKVTVQTAVKAGWERSEIIKALESVKRGGKRRWSKSHVNNMVSHMWREAFPSTQSSAGRPKVSVDEHMRHVYTVAVQEAGSRKAAASLLLKVKRAIEAGKRF